MKSTTKRTRVRRRPARRLRPATQPKHRERDGYVLDPDFEFFDELKALVLKASSSEKERLIRQISKLGRIKLAVIAGVFLDAPSEGADAADSSADLLIVGDDISKKKLGAFLKQLEAEVGSEVRFGVMDKDEFDYRYSMFDRFIRMLLEGRHEKIINRLGI